MTATIMDYQQPVKVGVGAIRPTYPGLHLQRHLTMNATPVFLRCIAVDSMLRAENGTLPMVVTNA